MQKQTRRTLALILLSPMLTQPNYILAMKTAKKSNSTMASCTNTMLEFLNQPQIGSTINLKFSKEFMIARTHPPEDMKHFEDIFKTSPTTSEEVMEFVHKKLIPLFDEVFVDDLNSYYLGDVLLKYWHNKLPLIADSDFQIIKNFYEYLYYLKSHKSNYIYLTLDMLTKGCLAKTKMQITQIFNTAFKNEFYVGNYQERLSTVIIEGAKNEYLHEVIKGVQPSQQYILPETIKMQDSNLQQLLANLDQPIMTQKDPTLLTTAENFCKKLHEPGFLIQALANDIENFNGSDIKEDFEQFKNVDLSKNLDFLEGIYGTGFKEQLQMFTKTYRDSMKKLDFDIKSEIEKLFEPINLLSIGKTVTTANFMDNGFYDSIIESNEAYISVTIDGKSTDVMELLKECPLVNQFLLDFKNMNNVITKHNVVHKDSYRSAAIVCIYGLTQRKLISFERVSK